MALRSRHTEKIQQLKTAFVREKQECEEMAQKKVADLSKQASQVCEYTLYLIKTMQTSVDQQSVRKVIYSIGLGPEYSLQ